MKLLATNITSSPISLGSSFASPAFYLGNIITYSIQAIFTGAPSGALSLQCSNDPQSPPAPSAPLPDTIENWTDIDGSQQAITEAGNHTWNVHTCGYLWVRLVYTRVSGSGALTARIVAKGA